MAVPNPLRDHQRQERAGHGIGPDAGNGLRGRDTTVGANDDAAQETEQRDRRKRLLGATRGAPTLHAADECARTAEERVQYEQSERKPQHEGPDGNEEAPPACLGGLMRKGMALTRAGRAHGEDRQGDRSTDDRPENPAQHA